jgi:hypothetical protein
MSDETRPNPNWEAEKRRITEIVKQHCAQIAEHVDTVHVFVTLDKPELGNTMAYDWGSGNWYARFGLIQDWITTQRQYTRNWAIRRDNEQRS